MTRMNASGCQGVSEVSNGVKDTPPIGVSGVSPLIEGLTPQTPRPPIDTSQGWHCPLCHLHYTSPLPLAHPPNHNCHSKGRPMRNRKMVPEEQT